MLGVLYLLLAVLNGDIHQLSILGLLGCGEDERWVGGSILGLVLLDGCAVLASGLAHVDSS
jgi:hypothetical protein